MTHLSVVIIGRNEGERLTNCIRSVQTMHGAMPVEIIYVDSDSTDDSVARAQSLGANTLIVHPKRPAAAIGRNAGWQAATAPYILFLDGDTLLHPDFVSAAMKILEENQQVAIVWGHRRERFPEKSWYQRTLDLDWIYPPGVSDFCGGDALMRREVLQQVGGYANLIAGEEPEMCQRVRAHNYQIWHIDAPMTLHDLAITRWSQYWRRAVRAGHAYAEVSQLLKNSAFPLWQREARKNLIHAAALLILFLSCSGLAIYLQSWLPILTGLGIFLLLSGRTAWKVRWKSNDWFTLFLYGLHSQFQHIPIAFGQLGYFYHRWLGKRRGLIEYK